MGCDIHSVGQVKKNGTWETVLQDVAGDDRSYRTFAILAGVRNGSGFAGCDTGDAVTPIAEPRGLPPGFVVEDGDETHHIPKGTPTGNTFDWADPEYRERRMKECAEETEVWMGDHSHSWLTLAEIVAYSKANQETKRALRGYVHEEAYLELRGTNRSPKNWSGGISGPGIVTVSQQEYEKARPEGEKIYVQYEWVLPIFEMTNMPQIEAELRRLAEASGVGPEDVRIVFGFDS